MQYNDVILADLRLKSVPIPYVIFDVDIRFTQTLGLYYSDPIKPLYELRWISLCNVNPALSLNAGDFFQHYTPLTLWNSEVPVFTLIEPTSFHRARKEVEGF